MPSARVPWPLAGTQPATSGATRNPRGCAPAGRARTLTAKRPRARLLIEQRGVESRAVGAAFEAELQQARTDG